VPKTPQEIAREILLKNGYLPSVAQAEDRSSGQPEVLEPAARGGNSPDALTEAQQELIEKRRQDALKRRRRAQQVARPNVVPPDRVEAAVLPRGRPPVAPDAERHRPPPRQARTAPGRSVYCTPHRVVTPENLPATNPVVEAEQVRPEYFWDDLEAAAEIVQWEKEHMAEVAIEQPPKPASTCSLEGLVAFPGAGCCRRNHSMGEGARSSRYALIHRAFFTAATYALYQCSLQQARW